MRFLEQAGRLQQLEDMAGSKMRHLQELERQKAELRSQLSSYKSSVEHLQESLGQKRVKTRAYKKQVRDLQAGKTAAQEAQVGKSTAQATGGQGGVSRGVYEDLERRLRIAQQRLGQGLKRHFRVVKRA